MYVCMYVCTHPPSTLFLFLFVNWLPTVVGATEGREVGSDEGLTDGREVGSEDGELLGVMEGREVGV